MVLARTPLVRQGRSREVPTIRHGHIESSLARLRTPRRNEWSTEISNTSWWPFNRPLTVGSHMVRLTFSSFHSVHRLLSSSFNQLDLPAYESYDKLRKMLLIAIRECAGFGFAWERIGSVSDLFYQQIVFRRSLLFSCVISLSLSRSRSHSIHIFSFSLYAIKRILELSLSLAHIPSPSVGFDQC